MPFRTDKTRLSDGLGQVPGPVLLVHLPFPRRIPDAVLASVPSHLADLAIFGREKLPQLAVALLAFLALADFS